MKGHGKGHIILIWTNTASDKQVQVFVYVKHKKDNFKNKSYRLIS